MQVLARVLLPGSLAALVASVAPARAAAQMTGPGASIVGVVFDSLRGVGLQGAVIRIGGTTREVRTNERGEFTLDSVKVGEMMLEVRHPLLDTLGENLDSRPFTLVTGQRGVLNVRTLSLEELRATSCPRSGANFGRAIMLGILRDADADTSLAGGTASLVYKDLFAGDGMERVRTSRIDPSGRFVICGLPDAISGTVQVARSGKVTAEVHVETKGQLFSTVGLTFGTTAEMKAVLRGRVTQQSGLAVPGVQITVAGTPVVAVTDSAGRYRLEGLPSGTVEVVARRIGFAAATLTANLAQREPRQLDFKIAAAQVLAAVKVVGKLDNGLQKVGFLDRKGRTGGYFMDPSEVERRHAQLFSDLLVTMPGIHVTNVGTGRVIESSRASGCMNFYVDNALFETYQPGDIDAAFSAQNIGAIEVYASATDTPPEFTVPGKACGTVVMWTRDRLSRP